MIKRTPDNRQLHTRRISLVTAIFLCVGSVLAVLVSLVVNDMSREATLIDDARAVRAATAALQSFQTRLRATVRDNAVWDDAYLQTQGASAADWAFENWGKTTKDYPLYDLAVVVQPDKIVLSAYNKGKPFDPVGHFGQSMYELTARAARSGQSPIPGFLASEDGIYLVAAASIQPYEEKASSAHFNTLIFAKLLSDDVLRQLDESFEIGGAVLVESSKPDMLSTPLIGIDGKPVAYLQWPSRDPGAAIYQHVLPYLLAAGLVLLTFLIGVLVTGIFAARSLHRAADRSHFKATHDALSGLLNRAGLLEEADKLVASGKPVAVHLVDLDGFKDVNDAWGHAIGDELIKMVAARLLEIAPTGASVARFGGDEFAILTSGTVADLGASILEHLRRTFHIGGRTIEVGASIGRSAPAGEPLAALELIRRADMALYRAKETGRGHQVEFHSDLDRDRERAAHMESRLRQALVADDIRPVFQPLVDSKTLQLRGVEALARWSPDTGPVAPDVFIAVAERCGLIDQLGRTILSLALDEANAWHSIQLSVNVSPIQLRNPNFAREVADMLKEKDFNPSRLTLEITEGVLMSNPGQAKRTIAALKAIGVKFALDDFGCGYASIGALREFGFDRMKIDRSLVLALNDEIGAGVLNATISLANALHIPVTAEGVETPEQAEALKNSGCDQLQGYLLGRPMSSNEIVARYLSAAA